MKKLFVLLLSALLLVSLCGCSSSSDEGDKSSSTGYTIAVPNDPSNEARALMLLEANGIIKLKDGAGITATKNDIVENPHNVKIEEVEAAQLPNILKDVDFAVINSNYAIDAGLVPTRDALTIEGAYSAYGNILAAREDRRYEPKILALAAALSSIHVEKYIDEKYTGSVEFAGSIVYVGNESDGYDHSIDYDALRGEKITVAASPTPHAEILEVAKRILNEVGIELEIKVFNDYVQPNLVVDSGEVDANYFQHAPYLKDFNANNGTHVVEIAVIHVEPMGVYGGKQTSLDVLK